MNLPRVVAAGVVAWLISIPLGYVVNTYVFADLMSANASVLRPEADLFRQLPIGFGASLLGYLAFAYIYATGHEGTGGVAEGIRFGALAGVVVCGLGIVWVYVSFPITAAYGFALTADSFVEAMLYGAIVGAIYKSQRV